MLLTILRRREPPQLCRDLLSIREGPERRAQLRREAQLEVRQREAPVQEPGPVHDRRQHELGRGAAAKVVLTSVVNRPWLLDWGLALTDFELRFTSKLCTPLRAFTDTEEVAARLGGFAPPEDS